MGVYSTNRYGAVGNYDVVANENYVGGLGAQQIMIECAENDMAIFEALLKNDFREVTGLREGTILESELVALNEGGVKDLFDKIKAGIMKVWQKIKGMIQSFITRISGVLTRDNKELVNKHKDKFLKNDLSKMKFKWHKPTGKFPELKEDLPDFSKFTTADAVNKEIADNYDNNEYLEKLLGQSIGVSSTTVEEYEKEVLEYMYDDKEEQEGLSSSEKSEFMQELIASKTALSTMKRAYNNSDKDFKETLKELDRVRNELIKRMPGTDENKNATNSLHLAQTNGYYKAVQDWQTLNTKSYNAVLAGTKRNLKEIRSIFIKGASFNPKSVKENTEFFDILEQASDYEVDSIFEEPVYA